MISKKIILVFIALLTGLAACVPLPTSVALNTQTALPAGSPLPPPTLPAQAASGAIRPAVPDFTHIMVIFFENGNFVSVIGNQSMPYYNQLAGEYTLLSQYYAVSHPSLPNFIATFGRDTFGISSDCTDCFIQSASLPDQIKASGRTWRAYLEDMPRPCYLGNYLGYAQKHDPFIYFDPIRLDAARCNRSIVPLTQFDNDLAAGTLPNFVYIEPNLCNSAPNAKFDPACSLGNADHWLAGTMQKLLAYLQPRAAAEPYLIVVTWDEGQTNLSCCGLPSSAGGRVATLLISPLARKGFQDSTPYTHYSLLKTIETGWSLPLLVHAADPGNA